MKLFSVILLLVSSCAYADAIARPITRVRMNRVTAGAASATRNFQVTFSTTKPADTMIPQTISVKNENTTAGDVAYINFEAAPATAVDASNGANIRIDPGETISIDVSVLNSSGAIAYIRGGANDVVLKFISGY